MTKTSILAALAMIAAFASSAAAEEQASPPSTPPHCAVDTTKEVDTGRPRNGVSVCSDNHSASVGVSVSGKELEHFFNYPIGQSDKSVAKQMGKPSITSSTTSNHDGPPGFGPDAASPRAGRQKLGPQNFPS